MVSAAEIRDEAGLQAWFQDCAPAAGRSVAFRAAMRVAPFVFMDREGGFPYLRLLLAIGIAARRVSPDADARVRDAFAAAGGEAGPLRTRDVPDGIKVPVFLNPDIKIVLRGIQGAVASVDRASLGVIATRVQIGLISLGRSEKSVYDTQWREIFYDAMAAGAGEDITRRPFGLRSEGEAWAWHFVEDWRARGGGWVFWADWYEGYLTGRPLDIDLLEKVALIPSSEWDKGDDHVNAIIAGIYRDFLKGRPTDVGKEAAKLPAPPPATVALVRDSMERNRDVLSPTFDAIEGLIALEIERLMRCNYSDDLDMAECRRQIGGFLALHDAIQTLRAKLPEAGPVTEGQAAASERLIRVYMSKFSELPHAKADEVVEGVWEGAKGMVKIGLIGATAVLGVSYGLPAGVATAVGAMIFAPKNAADLIKAAREAMVPGRGA
jgi:hypothetical protein